MLSDEHSQRALVALHLEAMGRSADDERLARSLQHPQPPRRRALRRALGQSLIGMGRRLAAEPKLRPARSR